MDPGTSLQLIEAGFCPPGLGSLRGFTSFSGSSLEVPLGGPPCAPFSFPRVWSCLCWSLVGWHPLGFAGVSLRC